MDASGARSDLETSVRNVPECSVLKAVAEDSAGGGMEKFA
jgi:hypothetical protein